MPHLSIQYSGQLDQSYDMQALCDQLGKVMTETGIFPRAGVRVRAFPARYETVADRHPEKGFVAMPPYGLSEETYTSLVAKAALSLAHPRTTC